MVVKILLMLIFLVCTSFCQSAIKSSHSDVGLNSKQIIQKYGYPLEVHSVYTKDGYILETYRIPHGNDKPDRKLRQPVLLMPGLFCSSEVFLLLGPGISLGFLLASNGYDVWLANYRGSTWSKNHTNFHQTKNKKQLYDYSFQEIGLYDVTANIDYILSTTNNKKIIYVGFSQGTASFFAMTALKPEYNNKISLMIALGPAMYFTYNQLLLFSFLGPHLDKITNMAREYNINEIVPYTPLYRWIGETFCNNNMQTQPLCAFLFYVLGGYSPNLNKTAFPVILSSFPAGSSLRSLLHFVQIMTSEQFQMYDFGATENVKRYNQTTPPKFNISQITAPVAMYYGGYDTATSRADVELTASELPNVVKQKFIKSYSHFDFLFATNVVSTLYKDVLETMKKYSL